MPGASGINVGCHGPSAAFTTNSSVSLSCIHLRIGFILAGNRFTTICPVLCFFLCLLRSLLCTLNIIVVVIVASDIKLDLCSISMKRRRLCFGIVSAMLRVRSSVIIINLDDEENWMRQSEI